MYLKLLVLLGCFSHVFSTPVSTPSTCTCKWTQWFNVDLPTNQPDDGDLETLDNIRAHGYDICRVPKDINCRSVRFPFVPYTELKHKTQCDPSTGLVCLNKDNVDTCIDFEVQFLCCTCEEKPMETTVLPAVTKEIPATQCENKQCSWTQWFNTHKPTPGHDGGEFENITAIRKQGYPVCNFPQAIQCRLQRFPFIPLKQLYSVLECSTSNGLVCLNKNQQDVTCLDFQVQFLCCVCDATTSQQTLTNPQLTTNPTTKVASEQLAEEIPSNMAETSKGLFSDDRGSGMLPNSN